MMQLTKEDLEGIIPDDMPEELLEGVELVSEFRLVTLHKKDGDSAMVLVRAGKPVGSDEVEPPFVSWMTAAEYLTAVTATKSNAGSGFERAVELIGSGAMTYRHLQNPTEKK